MKLTTDQALLKAIDENQDETIKPYLTKIRHRIKHQKNLELSKKIEVLEKLGYKSNELLWKKTKNYSKLKTKDMKINLIGTKEITDFEKEIGYELEVNERPYNATTAVGSKRFYVSFIKGEVMQGGCLVSSCGQGNTIDEALKDYAKEVSCARMAFEAYTPNRKEITFPKLIHTNLLNQ